MGALASPVTTTIEYMHNSGKACAILPTMKFGAHVSIAGGVQNAPENAADIGCEIFQMFTRSPQGGHAPALTPDVVRAFREACEEHRQEAWYIHTPYYINLASGEERIRHNSVRIIREELERGSALSATAVMTHLGSARDMGEEQAFEVVLEGVKKILEGYTGKTKFLMEIAAGAGMVIGDTFEELGKIVHAMHDQAGVCFDTQHAFASGYDLRTKESVAKVAKEFAAKIGFEHLYASHCNDSMVEFASHKDRHEHIGKGKIGKEGFRALFANAHFGKINYLLETEPGGVKEDLKILKAIRASLT